MAKPHISSKLRSNEKSISKKEDLAEEGEGRFEGDNRQENGRGNRLKDQTRNSGSSKQYPRIPQSSQDEIKWLLCFL